MVSNVALTKLAGYPGALNFFSKSISNDHRALHGRRGREASFEFHDYMKFLEVQLKNSTVTGELGMNTTAADSICIVYIPADTCDR